MTTKMLNEFKPDYNAHPGLVLSEIAAARGIMKMELARRVGLEEKTMSQILNGKAPIETETAISLERVLGIPAETWSAMSANYKLRKKREENTKRLSGFADWADQFPVKELVKRGMMEKPSCKTDAVEKILGFFSVSSPESLDAYFSRLRILYRRSPAFQSDTKAVASWLRIAEIVAAGIDSAPYDRSVFIETIKKIRGMTSKNPRDFVPYMVEACAQSGVALAIVKEIPGTRLSGASHWLNPSKALIALSGRHRLEDHFWFSFFHEAAHIIYHGKKLAFINCDNASTSKEESEADRFAANILLPPSDYAAFSRSGSFLKADILRFSSKVGVSPGIVVGRLQKDGHIKYDWHNDLRRRFDPDNLSALAMPKANAF